ncbi:MAG TPA: TauD/TfdA family dioxygenase, partial [Burkholderiales bacterium]|nr:TauD/TfdA family dioxygenase [Burkholderiales bacterium]
MPPGPVSGPSVWYGRDLALHEHDWIYRLSPAELAEIDAAVRIFKASGRPLAAISPEDFPLPSFSAALRRLGAELLEGRGFFMLRGFPVDDYTREEQAIAYMGLGSYFGRPRSQNAKGHLLGHVKDLGLDIGDPNVRYYQTNRRLEYHTDSIDVVGLLCLKTARAGGESFIVSSATIYNEILARRPDLLPSLFEPFATDRRGEVPEGMKPWFDIPVYHWHAGRLTCIYVRQYIESAQRNFAAAKRLTEEQFAAMDLMDEIANDPAVHLAMAFRP